MYWIVKYAEKAKPVAAGAGSTEVELTADQLAKLAKLDALSSGSDEDDDDVFSESEEEAKPAKPAKGGAGVKKASSKGAVVISSKDRGRGKFVTTVGGLEGFDVKLKDIASTIGKKLGTGASVTKGAKGQEITVQGEPVDELIKILTGTFSIPKEAIVVKD